MKCNEVHSTVSQLLRANGWTDIQANKTDKIMVRGAFFKLTVKMRQQHTAFLFCKLRIYYI
jgi:hypothetical protein